MEQPPTSIITEQRSPGPGTESLSGSAGPYFLLRLLLLATWLIVVNLWLVRHTGHGLRDPGVMGGIGGLVMLVLWALAKVIAAVDKKLWDALPGKLVHAAIDWSTLGGLYLVAGFLMLNVSSIIVIKDRGSSPPKVAVEPIDGAGKLPDWLCQPSEGLARSCVWTGPFGSSYRISVEGFLPRSVEVYPLAGVKLRPERSFQRLPTLLIRPPHNALDSLKRCDPTTKLCGQFRLCEGHVKDCHELFALEGHSGSFLIGWTKAIPPLLAQDWHLELMAEGLDDRPEIRGQSIVGWKSHKHLTPGSALGDGQVPLVKPGMRLRAEVRTKRPDRPLVACKEFVVEDVGFMDIAMTSTVDSGECPP